LRLFSEKNDLAGEGQRGLLQNGEVLQQPYIKAYSAVAQ